MSTYLSAAVALTAVLAMGCQRESGPTPEAEKQAAAPPQSMSANAGGEVAVDATRVAEITDYPQRFDGQPVKVRSDFERQASDWAFVLDEARALVEGELDNDVLVIGEQPLSQWGIDDSWQQTKVAVEGTVRVLPEEQLRTELGEKIGEEAVKAYANKPIIIASSVKKDEIGS